MSSRRREYSMSSSVRRLFTAERATADSASSPPFDPLSLSPLLWLKGGTGLFQDAAGTTPAVADGDPVGLWKDQSGNGNDASQATSAVRPTLKLAIIGSNSVVRPDGVGDFFNLKNSIGLVDALTTYAVVRRTVGTDAFVFGNTSNFVQFDIFSDENVYLLDDNFNIASVAFTGTSPMLLRFRRTGAGVAPKFKSTGQAESTLSLATGVTTLDAVFADSATYSQADLAELFVCNTDLVTAGTSSAMENYLLGRYPTLTF